MAETVNTIERHIILVEWIKRHYEERNCVLGYRQMTVGKGCEKLNALHSCEQVI